MHRIEYFVVYTAAKGVRRKRFGPDKGAALAWAQRQPGHRNPEVRSVTEQTIWSPDGRV